MINAKVGQKMLRITPPHGDSEGYSQDGIVESVDDAEIVLVVQVDILRRMRFNRKNGLDTVGLGTFLVYPC